MNTYYDILEISKDVSKAEIKKAYFEMVRKHPLERFPDKFMEIREAYEILSSKHTREEYDKVINEAGEVLERFDETQEFFKARENEKAIQVLEKINKDFPDILLIQSLLGTAYVNNNNTGKAIKIFENLTQIDNTNASFAGALAKAYLIRGWHKKSVDGFKKALDLDEDNLSLWMGLSEAYIDSNDINSAKKVYEDLIKRNDDKSKKFALSIYLSLFTINLKEGSFEELKNNLNEISYIAVRQEEMQETIRDILFMTADELVSFQIYNPTNYILEVACKLSSENEKIRKLKEEIDAFLSIEEEFERFDQDTNYSDDFVSLVSTRVLPKDSYRGELILLSSEVEFLNNINQYRKPINALSREYVNIYDKMKDFFSLAFNSQERNRRIKELNKYMEENGDRLESMMQEFISQYDYSQEESQEDDDELHHPIIRNEPKIGRNDMCPCGSGKKYKKCCGKS